MMSAMGLAYGTAAIVGLGFSADDPNAMLAASCLTGSVAGALTTDNASGISLSPGDFDEATVMLLSADKENPIVDAGEVSAFDRMDAFRAGVNGGITSCGVSAEAGARRRCRSVRPRPPVAPPGGRHAA